MNVKTGEYEGRLVGKRRLDSLLGVRGKTAFYLTKGEGREQLIEIVPENDESAATRASWDYACDLSEGPFLRIYATGKGEIDGNKLAYTVVDLPEDDLGEILLRRKLDEDEARTMFSAVAAALQALHQRGLAHGDVTPSQIFIVDGETRLSIDTLNRVAKHEKEQDLRQFGSTLVKAMTDPGRTLADDTAIARAAAQLPPPFRQIATGCIDPSAQSRWSAARILETLSSGSTETAARVRLPWPILAAAGLLVALLLGYALLRGPRSTPPAAAVATPVSVPVSAVPSAAPPPQPRQSAAAPAPQSQQTAPAPAPQTRQTAAAPPPPEPRPVTPAAGAADRKLTPPAAQEPARSSTDTWAVILGTYGHYEAAQKHAVIYGKQFPELHLRVFPPEGQGRKYLILLGSGLTQDAAERLRRDAVQQGAPSDTYVTKIVE